MLINEGAQWLSGRVLDSRLRGRGFEPHQHHCFLSLSKTHLSQLSTGSTQEDLSLITERLLMGRKESNQTYKQNANKWSNINKTLTMQIPDISCFESSVELDQLAALIRIHTVSLCL